MRVPFLVRAIPSMTFRAWLTPPPLGARSRELDAMALAGLDPVRVAGYPGFEVGSGPTVLALHGWGGRTAQMVPLARHLADHGYRVVAVDLPGHAGKPPTDIKKAAAAVRAVTDELDPQIVVGHSFAAMVMRLAFQETAPPTLVVFAPLLRVGDALEVFSDRLDLFGWARRGLRSRLETWDPLLWPMVSRMDPDQLGDADLLILHDPADNETPFAASAELAALRPNTRIVAVHDAGHSAILSDPRALQLTTGFLSRRAGNVVRQRWDIWVPSGGERFDEHEQMELETDRSRS